MPDVQELSRRLAVAQGRRARRPRHPGRSCPVGFHPRVVRGRPGDRGRFIAGLGEYEGREVLDVGGKFLVPGFIDAHMHVESVKLLMDELARLVLPLGTTPSSPTPTRSPTSSGRTGCTARRPLPRPAAGRVLHGLVLCARVEFESPAPAAPGRSRGLAPPATVIELAEMMNFPGVVSGSEAELEKLALPGASHVDGHAFCSEGVERLRRGGHPIRPRDEHDRRGARAAAGGDVGADPEASGAQPPRTAAARPRVRPHRRAVHRRPRAEHVAKDTSTPWSARRSRPEWRRKTR